MDTGERISKRKSRPSEVDKKRKSRLNRQGILMVSLLLVASFSVVLTVNPSFDLNLGSDDASEDDGRDPENVTGGGVSGTSYIYGPDITGSNGTKYRIGYYNLGSNKAEVRGWCSDTGYSRPSGALVIPETVKYNNVTYTVTSIYKDAFYNGCTEITTAFIPKTVTTAQSMFASCTGLTAITVDAANPNFASVNGTMYDKSISKIIQYPCGKTGTYTMPATVRSMDLWAFWGAKQVNVVFCPLYPNASLGSNFNGGSNVTGITLSNYMTGIPSGMPRENLTEISVPASNTYLSVTNGVLYNAAKTSLIAYPAAKAGTSYSALSTTKTVEANAFISSTKLTSITLPAAVTSIGANAFQKCTALTGITLPSSLTTLGAYAFNACTALTGITVPSGVSQLQDSTFSSCTKLASASLPSAMTFIGANAFSACTALKGITLPSSLTAIGANAFQGTGLTTINIPNYVNSIVNNSFLNCTSLQSVTVSSGNATYSATAGVMYNKNNTSLLLYPIAKAGTAFTVPSTVKTIGANAFYGSKLSSVDMPTVTTIETYAFYSTTNYINVTIPSTVSSIAVYAFYGGVKNFFFEGTNLPATIVANAFYSGNHNYYSHGVKAASWWTGKAFAFPTAKIGAYYDLTLTKASGETVFQGFTKVKVPVSTNNYATVTPITKAWTEQYVPTTSTLYYSTNSGSTWNPLAGVTLTADTTGQGRTGFAITYNINNGSGTTPTNTVGVGNVALNNGSGLSRTGYYLAGWNTAANGNGTHYNLGATYNLQSSVTLYAEWKQYTITFNSNSATSGSQAAVNGYGNTALPSSSTLTRTNYYLSGWNTNAAGTGTHYNLGATYNITGNVTLYAEWKQYTITYNANSATTGSNFTQMGYGSTVLNNGSSLARTNYYLAGWNTTAAGNGTHYNLGATYSVTGNVTLYAEWKQYTVTYNNNTGSGSIGSQSGVGLTLSNGSLFTKPGYTLAGWNTNAAGTGTPYTLSQAVTLSGNLTLYAVWNANPVTVTYHGNGGTGPSNVSGVTGGAWTLPTASQYTRPGYTLAGWATTSGGAVVYTPGQSTTFVHTITNVYAVWTAESMTVTFNGNGGTGSPASVNGVTGGTYTLPTAAQYTRPGYTLAGWDTNSAGTNVVYDAGGTTTFKFGETTLYAVWTADATTVTYHGNGGTGPTASSGYTGNSYTVPTAAQYTRSGYTLSGWSINNDGNVDYAPGTSQVFTYGINDLYAVWTANPITVNYHGNGGTGSPANVTDVTGGTWTLPGTSNYTRPGYTLVGWSTTLNGAKAYDPGQVTTFVYGINNVYAIWQGNPITVTFDANGGTGSPTSAAGIVGGSYVLPNGTQYTNSGYTLLGWDTNPAASTVVYNAGQTITFKNGETSLYAVWSGNAHTVTYNGNGGTGPSSASGSVGGAWTLPTAAQYTRPGYTLIGWSKTNGGAMDYTPGESTVFDVSVTNVYAIWSADSVTVTYNGNYGTGSPSDDTGNHDSPWTLPDGTAYTRPGYTLAGWSLSLNGAVEYTPGQVTVFNYAITDVYAVWTADPVTVTYDPKGGSGTPADSSGVTGGSWTLPTATEYTRPGYTLIGWDTAPAATLIVYTPGQTTVFAYDVTTVYAVWSPNSMTVNYHANGGTGSPSSSIGVTGGQWTLPSATDYTRLGYILIGWDTNPAATNAVYVQGTTATYTFGLNEVYAVWQIDTTIVYNVTVTPEVNGSASADNNAPNGGDTVVVTVTPRSGFLIDTITDNGTDIYGSLTDLGNGSWTYTISSILADHTVAVSFKVDTSVSYTVSGTVNPNAGTGGQLNEGFTVTLNGRSMTTISDGVFSFTVPGGFAGPIVVSKNGYTTATYYLNSVTEDKAGIIMDIAIRSYTVTFHGNGADPASGPWPQSFTVDHGYALSSMPTDPYQDTSQFAGWFTYDGIAFDPATPIVQNTDIYAYWYPLHEITVEIRGTGAGSVQVNIGFDWFDYTGPITIIGGTSIQIRAIPDSGHSFAGWTGHHTSADHHITLTPSSDMSLNATFEEPVAPPVIDDDPSIFSSWMFWVIVVLVALLAVSLILFFRERAASKRLRENIFSEDLDKDRKK